ncbi:hypothetical protein GCM10011586_33760 [Silvibacterium dinghuense]|nr:hypothetical protein GCM10011586_33760 [Silvibacterium dinghuense]
MFATLLVAGCARFSPKPAQEYVYVSAKRTFLRDRLAAVSNRVGEVSNGEKLLVLDHARRFYKVKDTKGEIGWIDGHMVIDQKVYDQFAALDKQHTQDAVIATGVLRDDSYVHVTPGRQADHFYLLPENTKLQLLVRASVPKPMPPQALPVPVAPAKPGAKSKDGKQTTEQAQPAGPILQDWWLVRDAQGETGWIWSRMLDVDIPDEISGLSEGQRYVGAYLLRKVYDPDSSFPDHQAPEYVTVLNSWKDGLPYDFDQVRVFTWNTKKHRYETAFRDRNLQGYLPVKISSGTFENQQEPVFTFQSSADADIPIDPATGAAKPAHLDTESFRLEGALVKKIGPPEPPTPKAAPAAGTAPAREKARRAHPARARERERHRHHA